MFWYSLTTYITQYYTAQFMYKLSNLKCLVWHSLFCALLCWNNYCCIAGSFSQLVFCVGRILLKKKIIIFLWQQIKLNYRANTKLILIVILTNINLIFRVSKMFSMKHSSSTYLANLFLVIFCNSFETYIKFNTN